ncbi:MAG: hypothetical protein HONDAALG_02422 [Gammaproteobacteria bacterium]|nr:hypothetical protein [Gammaproteobacteria bacterium]
MLNGPSALLIVEDLAVKVEVESQAAGQIEIVYLQAEAVVFMP